MYADSSISQVAGRNLKKLRIEAGYTTSQLAKLVNKSAQQMDRYERGVSNIDIGTLIVALKILDVDIMDFFTQLTGHDMGASFTQSVTDPQDKYLNAKLALGVETTEIRH